MRLDNAKGVWRKANADVGRRDARYEKVEDT